LENSLNLISFTRLALLTLGTMLTLGLTVFFASGWRDGPATASAAAQEPRELTVLAGLGQDTVTAFGYFPETLRIRAGDMVTWKIQGDATHTITFSAGTVLPGPTRGNSFGPPGEVIPGPNVPLPEGPQGELMRNPVELFPTRTADAPVETYSGTGFINSGRLRVEPWVPGVLGLESFSLMFDTPGLYRYVCLVHPEGMAGIIEVLPASVTDVPDQAEIDGQAQAEMAAMTRLTDRARTAGQSARTVSGPNDTGIWFVHAGNSRFQIDDYRVQLDEFMPRDVTVKSGDTIIWEALAAHTVTFVPAPPVPENAPLAFGPDGTPRLRAPAALQDPVRPSAVYDPTQFFSSANINATSPRGSAFVLTFDRPGTYEYFCLIHQDRGMKGTITVVPR
jgi:plastocyanin